MRIKNRSRFCQRDGFSQPGGHVLFQLIKNYRRRLNVVATMSVVIDVNWQKLDRSAGACYIG